MLRRVQRSHLGGRPVVVLHADQADLIATASRFGARHLVFVSHRSPRLKNRSDVSLPLGGRTSRQGWLRPWREWWRQCILPEPPTNLAAGTVVFEFDGDQAGGERTMFKILADTCIWENLGKDPQQRPLLKVIFELETSGDLG